MANCLFLLKVVVFLCVVALVNATFHYKGCFKDERNRDLSKLVDKSKYMTVERCYNACSRRGYKYFGLQAYKECFCGHSYGRYGMMPGSDCNRKCDGNKGQICGGGWRNSVYTITKRVPKIPHPIYKGCYKDGPHRDLGRYASGRYMTIQRCHHLCYEARYKYFGVQASHHCFCGNSYGRYGRASSSDCRMSCSSNRYQKCGGGWRNSVYEIRRHLPTNYPTTVYKGCFVDRGFPRDLGLYVASRDMNIQRCHRLCYDARYRYFGLQASSHCFCGNVFGRYGHGKSSECNMRCVADHKQTCGGAWRNSVYEIRGAPSNKTPASSPGTIRSLLQQKLKNIRKAHPSGVICNGCLMTQIVRRVPYSQFRHFHKNQLSSVLNYFPYQLRAKLKAIQYSRSTSFHYISYSVSSRSTTGSYRTYVAAAQRNGNNIKIGVVGAVVYGTMDKKYTSHRYKKCKKSWWKTKCSWHTKYITRGFHSNELAAVRNALEAECDDVMMQETAHAHL